LRTPEEAKVIQVSPSKTIIATTESAPKDKMERLKREGVQILITESKQERVNLKCCLSKLGEMGMMSLLVEGGSQVNGSFLDEGLIDKIFFFLSPKLMGDHRAPGIFGGDGVENLDEAIPLRQLKTRRMDEDILIEAYVGPVGACSQES
jgi:diaminohydroxyphosphoribosylaminopyrimidine deaminase / 5-amino-6-(5-phosphoribosylamino)uracil reductase